MLKRVQFEEWQAIITIIAFFLCFLTFLYFCWRAIRMSKKKRDHMSQLPLEKDESTAPSSHERPKE